MTGNQTMDYYVRPRHLYSHSRTCTRSGLCRRLSRLVESLICYLLDRASVHEISALVTWYQCMSDISSLWRSWSSLYLQPLWRSWSLCILYIFIMEILIYVYCTWRWPHMFYHVVCLFMAIVLLCIRDCYMYLQIICRVVLWYYADWVVGLPFGYLHHFISGMDFIMYFGHRITPLISYIRGHLL